MKGCLKWGGILFGIFIVVSVIIALAAGGGTSTPRARPAATVRFVEEATQSPTVTPGSSTPIPNAPAPTLTPDWMAPSYAEMCDTNNTMTDLQQEDYAASMAGKKIIGWVGEVYDVERDTGELYKVQVDMRGGIFSSRQVEILGVPRDVAAGLNVEQKITFDGTIKSVDMFMDDICNPINIIEATITPN